MDPYVSDIAKQAVEAVVGKVSEEMVGALSTLLRRAFHRKPDALRVLERLEKGEVRPAYVAHLRQVIEAMEMRDKQFLRDLTAILASGDGERRADSSTAAAGTDGRAIPDVDPQRPPRRKNPHFTGRESELGAIQEALGPGQAAVVVQARAVVGAGGIGKTELVTEFAYRHASKFPAHVWWMSCASKITVEEDLKRIARHLRLPVGAADVREAVLDWLDRNHGWLLVFDNVDDQELLNDVLPARGGSVLITSRKPRWDAYAASRIEVPLWSEAEAVQFLCDRLERPDELGSPDAAAIADRLQFLPLALEQAAAYMEDMNQTFREYRDALSRRPGELLNWGKPTHRGYDGTVATTWNVSFEAIRQHDPAAVDLLQLAAFVASDRIPESLFEMDHPALPPALRAAVAAGRIGEVVGILDRYSLVGRDRRGRQFRMHRLVQEVIRLGLTDDERRARGNAILELVRAALPEEGDVPQEDVRLSQLLPHAIAATQLAVDAGVPAEDARELLLTVGTRIGMRAQRQNFLTSRGDVMAIVEGASESSGSSAAGNLRELGRRLADLGHLSAATACLERALELERSTRMGSGPDDVPALLELAGVLQRKGDPEEARRRLDEVVRIREGTPDGDG